MDFTNYHDKYNLKYIHIHIYIYIYIYDIRSETKCNHNSAIVNVSSRLHLHSQRCISTCVFVLINIGNSTDKSLPS